MHWPIVLRVTTSSNQYLHAHSLSLSRFPWFLQFLHWRGISGGPRAARDGAELCFCFWHSGQEANEEVVSDTDDELHQPTGSWDPLLWPAHLYQAPWPRERVVLRPRALQRHGQQRVLVLSDVMTIWQRLWLLSNICAFLCVWHVYV